MPILPCSVALIFLSATDLWAAPCVTNDGDQRLFFTAEARDGGRSSGWLDPGQRLCAPGADKAFGTVGAFPDPDAIEGCSRLVPAGTDERLLHYGDVDRCRWATLP